MSVLSQPERVHVTVVRASLTGMCRSERSGCKPHPIRKLFISTFHLVQYQLTQSTPLFSILLVVTRKGIQVKIFVNIWTQHFVNKNLNLFSMTTKHCIVS